MEKIRVDVADLKLGMYVSELDRPWVGTPFLLQGFHLRSIEDIEAVRQVCDFVYVDPAKRRDPHHLVRHAGGRPAPADADFGPLSIARRTAPVYKDSATLEVELETARTIQTTARGVIEDVFQDVRMGRSLDFQGAKGAVDEMVGSVVRNPDALVWLSQLKNRDEYTSIHSLNVAILSLVFGRHLGLSQAALKLLGLGALLHDIGKLRVPLEVLNKPGKLSDEEFELMKRHPEEGRALLGDTPGIPGAVVDVAWSHHERLDGSGYPRGLTAAEISPFARMVAIVDVYDAVTSDRVYRAARSPVEILQQLYSTRDVQHDGQLVEQFIQCLGIYPIGSIVELSTGQVGIIISVNREQRLRPKVLLILNRDKRRYLENRIVDLAHRTEHHGKPLNIGSVLEWGAYGIDVADYVGQHGYATA